VGAETDAARAEVLASREALLGEVQRLEASARAAVDIPGKVRRAPAKTAGLAAGTAFVVLGGPQRLYRRVRRAIFGPGSELPKSLLPKDIEKTVRKLGGDGDKVRGTLEREFAHYLDDRAKVRRNTDAAALATTVAGNVLKPISSRLGKQLAERLFAPDSAGFDEAMAKVRARYAAQTRSQEAEAAAPGEPAGATTKRAASHGPDARDG
jgi:hypothetical protein